MKMLSHLVLGLCLPLLVHGKDAPSFLEDIVPALTRLGCNQGACHGKQSGQNGFKLSLRGFDPAEDHDRLTRESRGRRLNFAQPDASLMLLKTLGRMPHEGGQRMLPGSPYHALFADWIRAGAPGPLKEERRVARLEITPSDSRMGPSESRSLAVRAHYTDNSSRDVTWLTQFYSNDESTLRVSADGKVTALRAGEATARVHFNGHVAVARFTMPFTKPVPAAAFAQRNNAVDDAVFAKLQSLNIPPSSLSSDAAFLRRASLDVTGALPAPDEVRAFLADTRPDKRARLIDALLASPRYADYWTLQLADLFQNRVERDHDVRGSKGVRAFHAWLRQRVASNQPWDKLVREVLTAQGSVRDNPAVGYFITTVGENRQPEQSEVPDSAAQALLGTRIGCARCHNHPLERYTQDDFYHFAAFFAKVSLDRVSPKDGFTELVSYSQDEFQIVRQLKQAEEKLAKLEAELAGLAPADAEKKQPTIKQERQRVADLSKQRDSHKAKPASVRQPRTGQMMAARALDRLELSDAAQADPRGALANWLVGPGREQFSGAMINRLWKHFLGVGLVEPVDDLRESNPPSNAALWALLKREFVGGGYDLKHVMRLILNSRTYQLGSETLPANRSDDRFYSHFIARRLPAEVMLDAISDAVDAPESFPGHPLGLRAVQLPEPGVNSYFLSVFGRSDRVTACACERTGEVTLPQLLLLNNGESLLQKLQSSDGRLARLLRETDETRVVDELFLSALSRPPTAPDRERVALARKEAPSREAFYLDLFWALLSTKEFSFNH